MSRPPVPRRLLLGLLILAAVTGALALRGAPAERAAQASSGPPELLLPWEHGQSWLTGILGFHTSKDALDFFPPDTPLGGGLMCEGQPGWSAQVSSYWLLASAPGTVVQALDALVAIDHGGGWTSGYYHATDFQVKPGDQVQRGQRLAHPSTYGDCSTGAHVHFWVLGPDGQTTRDVTLSGIPATAIGVNERISETYNYPAGTQPTPVPATPTPAPALPPAPTPEPTPTPAPTPPPPPAPGDANCDGLADATDALIILREVAGFDVKPCAESHTDLDCSGVTDSVDALILLRYVAGITAALDTAC
jgi:hypothetical protein